MSLLKILSRLLNDRNPPDDISVKERLKASKFLRLINFRITKIVIVNNVYKIRTLND
tara:strand:- start:26 stop:196 length:171 start_codon:yes stop_codon:yes gene_type:complete